MRSPRRLAATFWENPELEQYLSGYVDAHCAESHVSASSSLILFKQKEY